MLISSIALAQVPPIDTDSELAHTSIDGARTQWTDDAERPEDLGLVAGATTFYAHRPLVYRFPDGSLVDVVSGVLRTDVTGGVAWQRFRGGVVVPVAWTAGSELQDGGGTGLGDLSLDGKLVVLDPGGGAVGLAVVGRVQLPTSNLDLPLSSPGAAGAVTAVASGDLGPLGFAVNLGPRFAPRTTVGDSVLDDALDWRLALSAPLGASSVAVEGAGRVGFTSPLSASSPLEFLGSAQTSVWSGQAGDLALRGGASVGVGGAVGVPAFRVLLGVTFRRAVEAAEAVGGSQAADDRDGDGVVEGDRCVVAPEDHDGWSDEDGCPDTDDDDDGVVDGMDGCRLEPEDRDGWKDEDGCPDPKTRVGVRVTSAEGGVWPGVEVNVVCGTLARTVSADMAIDVEPGSCTFGGGGADRVPAFSKTMEVTAGAPVEVELPLELPGPSGRVSVEVRGAEGEVVEQAAWSFDAGRALRVSGEATARLAPGPHKVRVFAQGYRDHEAEVVVTEQEPATLVVALAPLDAWLSRGRVQVGHPLTFEAGTATLGAGADATLRGVAEVLRDHPEVVRLRVEVNTGPAGEAATNQLLSDERGLVVRDALVAAGVASERVVVVGLGESRPIPSNAERVDLWAETAP